LALSHLPGANAPIVLVPKFTCQAPPSAETFSKLRSITYSLLAVWM
jgi:hypothetical protein